MLNLNPYINCQFQFQFKKILHLVLVLANRKKHATAIQVHNTTTASVVNDTTRSLCHQNKKKKLTEFRISFEIRQWTSSDLKKTHT